MNLANKITLLVLGAVIIPAIVIAGLVYPFIKDVSDYFLLAFFIISAFSIFIGLKVGKSLSDPIRSLSVVVNEFAKDPLSNIRSPIDSKDETGVLAKNFNNMMEKLKELHLGLDSSNQQLRASNQQLRANTQQLRAANQQLVAGEKTLKEKINELEIFNKATVGRELKMVELKKEIETLKKQIGNS